MDIPDFMFGRLPELLSRNVATAYVLPTVNFIIASLLLLNAFSMLPEPFDSLIAQPANQAQSFVAIRPDAATSPIPSVLPGSTSLLTWTMPFSATVSVHRKLSS
ncbi:MAG: hypothetical protein JW934_15625 [Anaerolineae bacterium]|nr:hypothetical protein [Anaerolineae bacterium]